MNWRDQQIIDKIKKEIPKASDELLEAIRLVLKEELTKRKIIREQQNGSS